MLSQGMGETSWLDNGLLSWILNPGYNIANPVYSKVVYGEQFKAPSAIQASIPAPQTQVQMTQAGAWTPDMALEQYGVSWKSALANSLDTSVVTEDTNWTPYILAAGAVIAIIFIAKR
jgi:hypothetical protein